MQPEVKPFFDEATNTVSYVVRGNGAMHCCIIDSVLNFDPKSGRTSTTSADEIITYIEQEQDLSVDWILETHAHADHLSAAPYLKEHLGGRIAIGKKIVDVQKIFGEVFNVEPSFQPDGRQFDHLFGDEDEFRIGLMEGRVMHTPGHTPACLTYLIGDTAFVGDTLFMPDYGTARADFPGGDAATLYQSIQKILSLPPKTRLFLCHDYKAPGRDHYAWESTVAEQRRENVHIHEGVTKEDFVKMRVARDQTLDLPTLLLPSIQINMRGGHFPPPEDNGVSYLKLPLNSL